MKWKKWNEMKWKRYDTIRYDNENDNENEIEIMGDETENYSSSNNK